MLCYSLQENNHITLGSIVYYTILGDTTLTHSDIFFVYITQYPGVSRSAHRD